METGLLQYVFTFDEVTNLGLYWSFLQVLDHHVGNSSQMTHVASPGATLSPVSHIYKLKVRLSGFPYKSVVPLLT